MVERFSPVMNRHRPFLGGLLQRQERQLQRSFFVAEATADFDDLAQPAIQ